MKRFVLILLTLSLLLGIVNLTMFIVHAEDCKIPVATSTIDFQVTPLSAQHTTSIVQEAIAVAQQEAIKNKHFKQYPYAAKIWYYLKSKGYNDYVCAGIMGNIMVEVGGGTLKLKPNAYGKGYYGICQWGKHYPKVWGKSLDYQCDFLEDTIRYEFKVFGKLYKKGFNYEKFTNLTDERAAALAFAKCYERCSSKGYAKRQNCAEIAYDYFT